MRTGTGPRRSLLDDIIACGEAAVRPFGRAADAGPVRGARVRSDKASSLSYYALGLLGSLRIPAALPALIRAFPLVDEDTQEWMPDWIVPLGPDGYRAAVRGHHRTTTAGEYHRATASNIAVELGGRRPGAPRPRRRRPARRSSPTTSPASTT